MNLEVLYYLEDLECYNNISRNLNLYEVCVCMGGGNVVEIEHKLLLLK